MKITVNVGPKVQKMVAEQRDLLTRIQKSRSPSGAISELSPAHTKITDEIILCLGAAAEKAINEGQCVATTV